MTHPLNSAHPELGTPEHATAVTRTRHPGVAGALAWLTFSHLPPTLQNYSRPFYQTAVELIIAVPVDSPELTTALNKLVEAKDSAVRAGIRSHQGRPGPVPRPAEVADPPTFAGTLPNHPVFPTRPIRDNPQA